MLERGVFIVGTVINGTLSGQTHFLQEVAQPDTDTDTGTHTHRFFCMVAASKVEAEREHANVRAQEAALVSYGYLRNPNYRLTAGAIW